MKPLFVCGILLCACYNHRTTSVAEIRVMAPARVELTESGTNALAVLLGPRAKTLNGVLHEKSDTSISIGVSSLLRLDGRDEIWKGERIGIPTSAIARIQVREFSALRTGLLLGGIAGGALLVRGVTEENIFGRGGSGGSGGGQ